MTDDYGEVSLAEWCQANCYVLMSVNKSTQYLLSSGEKKKKKKCFGAVFNYLHSSLLFSSVGLKKSSLSFSRSPQKAAVEVILEKYCLERNMSFLQRNTRKALWPTAWFHPVFTNCIHHSPSTPLGCQETCKHWTRALGLKRLFAMAPCASRAHSLQFSSWRQNIVEWPVFICWPTKHADPFRGYKLVQIKVKVVARSIYFFVFYFAGNSGKHKTLQSSTVSVIKEIE